MKDDQRILYRDVIRLSFALTPSFGEVEAVAPSGTDSGADIGDVLGASQAS